MSHPEPARVSAGEDSIWQVRDDVAWTDSGEERVVVLAYADHAKAKPAALEGSAALIWHTLTSLDRPTDARVADEVARQVETTRDVVYSDVRSFLTTLESLSLIERAPGRN